MQNETTPNVGEESQSHSCAPSFLTIRQYAERYPWPSESGLRWMVFHAKSNGLESALIRVGKRIVLDLAAFNVWVRSHGKEA